MTLFQGPPPAHLPALSAALTCLLTLGLDFLCLLSFALGSGEADRTSSLASSFLGAACSLLWVSPAETLPYRGGKKTQTPPLLDPSALFHHGITFPRLHPLKGPLGIVKKNDKFQTQGTLLMILTEHLCFSWGVEYLSFYLLGAKVDITLGLILCFRTSGS